MEIHNRESETKAVARERYQYALGLSLPSENAMFGKNVGSNTTATSNPTMVANKNSKNDWMLTEDSLNSTWFGLLTGISFFLTKTI
jgi:hypothetical protein